MPTKFTDRFMAALKLERGKDRLVFDAACPGLGVRVTAKGTKVFVAQWTDPATRRKVREPLGVWGSLTVDQAREAARARLGAVAKGIDPRAERLRQRAEADRQRAEEALTLGALLEEWGHSTWRIGASATAPRPSEQCAGSSPTPEAAGGAADTRRGR
jgi:hypothetical protein